MPKDTFSHGAGHMTWKQTLLSVPIIIFCFANLKGLIPGGRELFIDKLILTCSFKTIMFRYLYGLCSHPGCLYLIPSLHVYIRLLQVIFITKTCLHNFDPLKPHFYIVKLGYTGVYIIFLIFAQKLRLMVLVRTEAILTSTHNLCFEQIYENYHFFFLWQFSVFGDEIFHIFE